MGCTSSATRPCCASRSRTACSPRRSCARSASIARRYDRGYGHFTTRQNIQYNWPKLEEVPDILAELAAVEMHAIQTSGNCIRNTTSDHLAGVDARTSSRIRGPGARSSGSGRRFIPSSPTCRANSRSRSPARRRIAPPRWCTTSACTSCAGPDGEPGFEILAGGGLGRTPIIGQVVREFLPREHLLSYLEAMLRVYNREGRRDNITQGAHQDPGASRSGIEEFRRRVEAEWESHQGRRARASVDAEIERMRAFFAPPAYRTLADTDPAAGPGARRFAPGTATTPRAHKMPGYRAVYHLAEEARRGAGRCHRCADGAASPISPIATASARCASRTRRIWCSPTSSRTRPSNCGRRSTRRGLATPNIGTLTDMICCPGLDFCSLANAGSIEVAKLINERFDDYDYLYDLGEIDVKMSGCMNACGHHHVGAHRHPRRR